MSRAEIELCSLPRSSWIVIINEWIFNERDRAIIKRRLLDGITYEKLADEFDMSVRQIKRICEKAIDQIATKI